eukprot:CAMPEP_0118699384 /NCGR_PEP_ID=MMETSP0800-20121206/15857_1 /TAXON_ID=210618 ORGANISM="Striatella unipunctata, Strain CCMP2910" /NCGR_SAMPLE_ID=MMETSP0800 /ASSEMBLY_ACC=CAM_ASM_000638 /LENGTH=204 /DNA_ID=CAMNT_0006599571 /DNA_START=41 /DNA_END=655 /DNA_ORIENTATION=+
MKFFTAQLSLLIASAILIDFSHGSNVRGGSKSDLVPAEQESTTNTMRHLVSTSSPSPKGSSFTVVAEGDDVTYCTATELGKLTNFITTKLNALLAVDVAAGSLQVYDIIITDQALGAGTRKLVEGEEERNLQSRGNIMQGWLMDEGYCRWCPDSDLISDLIGRRRQLSGSKHAMTMFLEQMLQEYVDHDGISCLKGTLSINFSE